MTAPNFRLVKFITDLTFSLSLSCSRGLMSVDVHDTFLKKSPFRPVHRQFVQSADILVVPVHLVVRPFSFRSSSLVLPSISPTTTCSISLSSCSDLSLNFLYILWPCYLWLPSFLKTVSLKKLRKLVSGAKATSSHPPLNDTFFEIYYRNKIRTKSRCKSN